MFKEVDRTYNQLKCGDTVCSYKYTNYHTQHEAPSLKAIKDIIPFSDSKAMLETLTNSAILCKSMGKYSQ